jgi:hypothetical protein
MITGMGVCDKVGVMLTLSLQLRQIAAVCIEAMGDSRRQWIQLTTRNRISG